MKSMAESVAFPSQPSQAVDVGLGGAALDMVNPSKVSARSNIGIEVSKQRSRDSANVIKVPALSQLKTLPIRRHSLTTVVVRLELSSKYQCDNDQWKGRKNHPIAHYQFPHTSRYIDIHRYVNRRIAGRIGPEL